jgi:hypothetical protein
MLLAAGSMPVLRMLPPELLVSRTLTPGCAIAFGIGLPHVSMFSGLRRQYR